MTRKIATVDVVLAAIGWWILIHAVVDLWGLGKWVLTHLTALAG